MKKRLEDLQALAKKLKDTAAARTRDVAVTEVRLYDAAVAAAKAIEESRARAATAQPPTETAAPSSAPSAQPPRPAAPAELADYAVTSFPAQVAEALRPLLPAALVADITAEREPMAMFKRAQKALLDPGVKPPVAPAVEVRDAAIAALRLHEARVYADRYAARYADIDAVISTTLSDIKTAHGAACTCKE